MKALFWFIVGFTAAIQKEKYDRNRNIESAPRQLLTAVPAANLPSSMVAVPAVRTTDEET
jgi:hypothetical protein